MKRRFCDPRQITLLSTLVLAACLSIGPQTSLAQQESKAAAFAPPNDRILINTELVSLTVTVADKAGRYVAGLDRRAFAIYEDDVRQEIGFFSDRDAPASIGVIFDVSASMSGERIIRAGEALARFIQTGHPEDEYSLISFNDNVQLLLDRVHDGGALLSRFGGASPGGNTALYDAVALGIETLTRSRYEKRALVVISDGEDNRSRSTFNQVKLKLLESGVMIYTIVIGPLLPRSNGRAVMHDLASASGGKSFFPSNGEAMSEGFEEIALEMRHQYSIAYVPAKTTNDGRWRRLKVIVTPPSGSPRLIVRNRKGYYATLRLEVATAGPFTEHSLSNR
ncbi:MAG: VWA domain-containing protein [Acidobacteria bacterium]|nr:VWA domain-containing protein [Acidobacteriota bacterium]